jgi:hypothetical protein
MLFNYTSSNKKQLSNQNFKTDAVLIKRLREGDTLALTELYNTYWQSLFMSAYNIIKDKELCEDIIQDIFMNIWHNREKLEINISLKVIYTHVPDTKFLINLERTKTKFILNSLMI